VRDRLLLSIKERTPDPHSTPAEGVLVGEEF
jgi:hypothetical protein